MADLRKNACSSDQQQAAPSGSPSTGSPATNQQSSARGNLHLPWERSRYRKAIVRDLGGSILEFGASGGKNLRYYKNSSSGQMLHIKVVDSSPDNIQRARRNKPANLNVDFVEEDFCHLPDSWKSTFDWVVSSDLFPQLPTMLQPVALEEVSKVLKPGGRFRIVEIVASGNRFVRWKENMLSLVKLTTASQLHRWTLTFIRGHPDLIVDRVQYIKGGTDLLIEGHKHEPQVVPHAQQEETPEGTTVQVFELIIPKEDDQSDTTMLRLVDLEYFMPRDHMTTSERL